MMDNENREKIAKLYESCSKGEITVDEREDLILAIRNNEMFESEMNTIEKTENNKEMFERVKTALYLRCSEHSITEAQRDQMIAMARDKFITE